MRNSESCHLSSASCVFYIVKLQIYQKVQGLPTLQVHFLFRFVSNFMAEEPRRGPLFALGCHMVLEVLHGF